MGETGGSTRSGGQAHVNAIGKIETRGIEFIEPEHRLAKMLDLFWVFFAAEFCYAIMLFGGLPLLFGLGWWSSVAAITVGLAAGSLLFAPMALFGPRTGTNSTVSSGAHFGVTGRILGSWATQLTALTFFVLTTWTGGLALEYGFHRLFHTPTGKGMLVVGILVIWAATAAVTVLGHATLVANFKFVALTCGAISLAMLPVFASHFHALPNAGNGHYLLSSYWATWVLSATIAASIPISYGPVANDYARYLPESSRSRTVFNMSFAGMFIGCWVALLIGAFVTTAFKDIGSPFVSGLIDRSPLWFVIFLIYAGVFGNVANGALALYNATLDLHAIIWRLRRWTVALLVGTVGLVGTIVGTVVYDSVSTIEALVSLMIVTVAPWMVINTIGYLACRGEYHALDLHAFTWAEKRHLSAYWFTGGFNLRAIAAWVPSVVVGMMFVSTTLFTGPFVKHVNGIDLSFISSIGVSAVVYVVLLMLFPEPRANKASGLPPTAQAV